MWDRSSMPLQRGVGRHQDAIIQAPVTAMPVLFRDFETRSTLDLKDVGAWRYSTHALTGVWCCAYAVDDGPIQLWIPGNPVPPEWIEASRNSDWLVSAFNDQFERLIEQHIMGPRYGWPIIPIERHRCSQAASMALALPASLKGVAAALGLAQQKADSTLMRQMARPRKPRKDEDPNGVYWFDDAERLAKLYAYCEQDVAVERELSQRLMPLSPAEQELRALDAVINDRGLYLDGHLLDAAIRVAGAAHDELETELQKITGGAVDTVNEVAKLQAWLAAQGCEVTDKKAP
jgi:DNA polymerase